MATQNLANATPANVARAAVEGMLCGLAAGLDALISQGVIADEVRLVGGAAQSAAAAVHTDLQDNPIAP